MLLRMQWYMVNCLICTLSFNAQEPQYYDMPSIFLPFPKLAYCAANYRHVIHSDPENISGAISISPEPISALYANLSWRREWKRETNIPSA